MNLKAIFERTEIDDDSSDVKPEDPQVVGAAKGLDKPPDDDDLPAENLGPWCVME